MGNNLISIVLTLYNKAPYIEETIFSIYKQTYTNRELIIVDDCSTDGSLEIAKSFCEKLGIVKKCKFIQNEKNLWVAKTFEIGLKEAKGDWISMCDGDDILMKNKLEIDLEFCLKNDVDLCYSDLTGIDENNNLLFNSWIAKLTKNPDQLTLYKILSKNHICGTSIFFNKKLSKNLCKINFHKEYYQDLFVVLYAYIYGFKIGRITFSTVYYRRCDNCITHFNDKVTSNQEIINNWRKDFSKHIDISEYLINIQSTNELKENLEKFKVIYSFFLGKNNLIKTLFIVIKHKWGDMLYPIFIYQFRYMYESTKLTNN